MSDSSRESFGLDSIREVPDPVLRRPARPVSKVTRSVKDLMQSMCSTMTKAYGIGLAAPQVGVKKRIITVLVDGEPVCLANPEVVESEGSQRSWEGCLSVPGFIGLVDRPQRVTVMGLDENGRKIWVEGEGMTARALLHEIDHLDGILFIDRAEEVEELPPAARLRLVFMGTPEFALVHLKHLSASGCRVMAVVTQPDRPRGRGQRLSPTPVKEWAQDRGIEVLSPTSVKDPDALARLEFLEPDVIVTSAFGQILPRSLLRIPRWGAINVHASLLPRYRGAAPIQRAIMEGAQETGVTIMVMDEGLDTGPILLQERIPIGPEEGAGSLHGRLAELGSSLLLEALNQIALGTASSRPQEGEPSYAPAIERRETIIDWNRPPEEIQNLVRGLSPYPGARTSWRQGLLKVRRVKTQAGDHETADPGRVTGLQGGYPQVAVGPEGRGRLLLIQLQPAGRPVMAGDEFANGYEVVGSLLGEDEGTDGAGE